VRYDRLYLLHHERTRAVKVGIASGTSRVAGHERRGYRLVAQWASLEHTQARESEAATLRYWRSNNCDVAPAAPPDGRTETTSGEHLQATIAHLIGLLGAPSCIAEPAIPDTGTGAVA
jgi:hypothetical protein